ncbi:hypothetical protein EV121DRAFT_297515 [Schizophyllum commune]
MTKPLSKPEDIAFARQQCEMEVELRQFSPPFGPALLPGMYGVPIHVVPKPGSLKKCLVVEHSAGAHPLNGMIPKARGFVHLDNLEHFGAILRRVRHKYGHDAKLVMWKSDVAQVYHRIPMHPLWQIQQTVFINGYRYVDRDNNFGNRAAGAIWIAFFSLVIWIAIYVKLLADLLETTSPSKQVAFLCLLDELGIPHERPKQLYGEQLEIIGFVIDPNAMTITMSASSKSKLIAALRGFTLPHTRRSLREFQQVGGWCNWSFNVHPLLRPGLCTLYHKMRGKTQSNATIRVSARLCRELLWMADHMSHLPGVRMLELDEWGNGDEDVHLFADASGVSLGFWCPSCGTGFQCVRPGSPMPVGLFYNEALAVLSALHHAIFDIDHCILIFSDNTNTIDMFNSMRADQMHNRILMTAINTLLNFDCELRVFHIPGTDNSVADTLSCFDNQRALQLIPGLKRSRQPPCDSWTRECLEFEHVIAVGASIETSTALSYSSALNSYLEFCRLHGFPITPTIDTLTFYVVFMSWHVKPSTVSVYLSGICNQLEPFYPNIRELRNGRLVSRTLAGCKKLYGSVERRKRALTREELRALHPAYLSSTNHDDVLFWPYFLQVSTPSCTSASSKIIMRPSVPITPSAFDFYLPGHKADRLFKGNPILLEKLDDLDDPYAAFNVRVQNA